MADDRLTAPRLPGTGVLLEMSSMPLIKELEVVLPFLAELAEHRQQAIATLASHLVEVQEQEETMTAAEIDHLRDLDLSGAAETVRRSQKNPPKLA